VSDTGKGIDPLLQSRIFEPFFTTKDSGTGLGLSVVYGVMQNHGGYIDLESEPGHGTSFTLYFPRAAGMMPLTGPAKRRRLPRGKENILIIDDETAVCEIANDMMSGLGYKVYVEHDGRSGTELYRTRQANIDLVLLDMNMPIMGGKQTFDVLRTINPNVRIVIITGYGREGVDPSAFSSPVNGFLQKPFQIELLATTIRSVLDARSAISEKTGVR
jgi:CheY-like chemotaxis protein